ncbi:hypothetical protein F5X98DRAFT_155903 [Xylaria grammica]|nr:hypothetical protein F5X98DRAFT_155903 [Xylaria grammica]
MNDLPPMLAYYLCAPTSHFIYHSDYRSGVRYCRRYTELSETSRDPVLIVSRQLPALTNSTHDHSGNTRTNRHTDIGNISQLLMVILRYNRAGSHAQPALPHSSRESSSC